MPLLPIDIGSKQMIVTNRYHYVGRVVQLTESFVAMDNVSEVYATGSLATCYGQGKIEKHEAMPRDQIMFFPLGGIVVVMPWKHKLPND